MPLFLLINIYIPRKLETGVNKTFPALPATFGKSIPHPNSFKVKSKKMYW